MTYLAVRNLHKYQHYKDRNPPWVKLHRDFLTDYELRQCTTTQRLFFACAIILASETDNRIPYNLDYLSQRCGFLLESPDIEFMVKCTLLQIVSASKTLASSASSSTSDSSSLPNGKEESERKTQAVPIPDDWFPKENHQKLANARGLELNVEAAHFRGKAQEMEWVTKNWDLKFKNWMLQEVKFRQQRRG